MDGVCRAGIDTRTTIFQCSGRCHHFGMDCVRRHRSLNLDECIRLDRIRFPYTLLDTDILRQNRPKRIEPMDDNLRMQDC